MNTAHQITTTCIDNATHTHTLLVRTFLLCVAANWAMYCCPQPSVQYVSLFLHTNIM